MIPYMYNEFKKKLDLRGGSAEIIQVQCYNLNDLLNEQNISHVDYLSIDTEGGEFDILRSIDFSRISIDVIDVENNYREAFEPFLATFGYKKIASLGADEIYKKQN